MARKYIAPAEINLEHLSEGIDLALQNSNSSLTMKVCGVTQVQAEALRVRLLPFYDVKVESQRGLYSLTVKRSGERKTG